MFHSAPRLIDSISSPKYLPASRHNLEIDKVLFDKCPKASGVN